MESLSGWRLFVEKLFKLRQEEWSGRLPFQVGWLW